MFQLSQSVFITGTDTAVGKTFVSCQLLDNARQAGLNPAAFKPVAAGCEWLDSSWKNDDALRLQRAAGGWQPYDQVNPIALPLAASPHLAATEAGQLIQLEPLVEQCRLLQQSSDCVLVEGAGGWYAPISETRTMADLAVALNLPVILVVGIRLGCLNHARLSLQAIELSGLRALGWIANEVDADTPHYEANRDWLRHNLQIPLLAEYSHQS